MRQLLARNRAIGQQILAASQVILRTRKVGDALRDQRLQLLALREQAAHVAHRTGQLRLGAVDRHPRVGRIEHGQHLAALDALRVVHVHREHRARHLAGDLHQVAADVGVVGALVIAADQVQVRQPHQAADHRHDGENQQGAIAGAVVGFGVGWSMTTLAR